MKIDFSGVSCPRESRPLLQVQIDMRKNSAVSEDFATPILRSVDFHDLTPSCRALAVAPERVQNLEPDRAPRWYGERHADGHEQRTADRCDQRCVGGRD